jgi:hypothetical protein
MQRTKTKMQEVDYVCVKNVKKHAKTDWQKHLKKKKKESQK